MNTQKINILMIGGPTASGKSALAMDLAKSLEGVLINGDSMQVYKDLQLLTSKPSKVDLNQFDHRLYGILELEEPCFVAKWQTLALKEIETISKAGKLPIIVGGTGLYLQSLVDGLSIIPEISSDIRHQARADYDQLGPQQFHEQLKKQDPIMGEKLRAEDRQRCIRAWEVYAETGKSISEWQKVKDRTQIDHLNPIQILLLPEKNLLNAQAEKRFDQMMEQGALDEVRDLLNKHPNADHPLSKAVGVPELTAYLRGEVTLHEAIELAKISTRQYSKRQFTWFRNQVKNPFVIEDVYTQDKVSAVLEFVRGNLKS